MRYSNKILISNEEKQQLAERNKKIPTEEIERDISDTQVEITVMKREIKGFRILGDRWSMMRADARESGIEKRKTFIQKLETILEVRASRTK